MNVLQDILQAEHKIRPYIRTTPLEFSAPLSKLTEGRIFLKLENTQYTGSFKVRGAMNALLSLTPEQRAKGVITASSGNHGLAVAFGLHTLKMPGIIFVPEDTSATEATSRCARLSGRSRDKGQSVPCSRPTRFVRGSTGGCGRSLQSRRRCRSLRRGTKTASPCCLDAP